MAKGTENAAHLSSIRVASNFFLLAVKVVQSNLFSPFN